MILNRLLTEKPPVACTTIPSLIFGTERCSSTQAASFVTFVCIVIRYKVSQALHTYCLAIAALIFVIML